MNGSRSRGAELWGALQYARMIRKRGVVPPSLAGEFMALHVRDALRKGLGGPGEVRFGGFTIHYFSRRQLKYLLREVFARSTYAFRAKQRDPRIIDCGANIGVATLFFKTLYPAARVTAFEPDPQTFALLRRNVEENCLGDVELRNQAASDAAGHLSFYVDKAVPGHFRMSLVPERMPDSEVIDVEAVPLSTSIDERVDLLKLDVEGAEGGVIADLSQTGALRRIDQLIMEYHHNIPNQGNPLPEILERLTDAGFSYQIVAAEPHPVDCVGFQDILVHASRAA
jgi:FkbM family methyltransferase